MPFRRYFFAIVVSLFGTLYAHAGLPAVGSAGEPLPTLAPILEKINPAVVNIATFATRKTNNPLMNDPVFRHFFNMPEQRQPQRRQQSAGSGVIIDIKSGTVVTNHHVIDGADEIHVLLHDGRDFKAELIGSDPEADIAVLKIKAKNLTQLERFDSNNLRVGDFVLAIGNPFGLGQTVTTGIVSALGRTGLNIENYEDFIQTDASINPGNSGGALVNLRGELVGINTAIIAPSGGNVGIGFAIPINMAMASVNQILDHGEVRRGQIGVSIQDVSTELQKAFGLKNGQQGVLITGVADNSEADKAGLLPGDVIVAVNDEETTSTGQLRNKIGMRNIGDKVKITLIRDGKKKTLKVGVGERFGVSAASGRVHKLFEGVEVRDNPKGSGVVVENVDGSSVAAVSGLRPGDIVIGANRLRVESVSELRKALKRSDDQILLHLQRGMGTFYLVIEG